MSLDHNLGRVSRHAGFQVRAQDVICTKNERTNPWVGSACAYSGTRADDEPLLKREKVAVAEALARGEVLPGSGDNEWWGASDYHAPERLGPPSHRASLLSLATPPPSPPSHTHTNGPHAHCRGAYTALYDSRLRGARLSPHMCRRAAPGPTPARAQRDYLPASDLPAADALPGDCPHPGAAVPRLAQHLSATCRARKAKAWGWKREERR